MGFSPTKTMQIHIPINDSILSDVRIGEMWIERLVKVYRESIGQGLMKMSSCVCCRVKHDFE